MLNLQKNKIKNNKNLLTENNKNSKKVLVNKKKMLEKHQKK